MISVFTMRENMQSAADTTDHAPVIPKTGSRGETGSRKRRRTHPGINRGRRGSMIRHAFCQRGLGSATAVGALAVAMIEPPFRRLLVAAVGRAELKPAGTGAAGRAAIDLPTLTGWADEENIAATGGQTSALPENRPTFI